MVASPLTLVVISLFSLSDPCSLERIYDSLAIICLKSLIPSFFS